MVARLREIMLTSTRLFADEPWGGSEPPAVVYSYAPGRGHHHAQALLGGYRGIQQCDGYDSYEKLVRLQANEQGVTLVFCWSHVRRGFYDLAKTKTAPIATEALKRIAALYDIEVRVRGKSEADRLAARQAESRQLVLALRTWFEQQLKRLPARGTTADAIRYTLNHWDGLERFLADGRIELDTNSIERSMRPIALSRKNALFAGSDEGGENWACLASLVETYKLNGVNPEAYIDDVLTRLVNGWPQSRLDELLPWILRTPNPY